MRLVSSFFRVFFSCPVRTMATGGGGGGGVRTNLYNNSTSMVLHILWERDDGNGNMRSTFMLLDKRSQAPPASTAFYCILLDLLLKIFSKRLRNQLLLSRIVSSEQSKCSTTTLLRPRIRRSNAIVFGRWHPTPVRQPTSLLRA